jgi:glycosyltransferase involved in cell wall biosynthesis
VKILFLSTNGRIGGAERVLLDMISSCRVAHPEWQLALIVAAPGELCEEAKRLGAAVELLTLPLGLAQLGDACVGSPCMHDRGVSSVLARVGRESVAIIKYTRRLARSIHRIAPTLVHSNGFKMHLLAAWASPRAIPLVWHFHDFVTNRPVMSRLLLRHARRCSVALANSTSVCADVRYGLRGRLRVRRIWNAVDLSRFSPNGATYDLDALSGLQTPADGTIRVGLMATMAWWKGHETFLEAISKLSSRPAIRGYIIGGPIYGTRGSQFSVNDLRVKASQLGIAGKVGFTGFVSEPAAAMRALDVVVHASTASEPFGLVIAEAAVCGRAIIASAAGGVTEITGMGELALLHRPGDANGLADQIALLATKPDLRTRLGTAARQKAVQWFTRERLATELAAVYQEVAQPLATA